MGFSSEVAQQIAADILTISERTLVSEYEARLSPLSDLARLSVGLLSADLPLRESLGDLGSRLRSLSYDRDLSHTGTRQVHRALLASFRQVLTDEDRAVYVRFLLSHLSREGRDILLTDFLPAPCPTSRVACIENGFAEEAYALFSVHLHQPEMLSADSLRHAVSFLTAGEADYVILPYLDTDGLPLRTTEEWLTGLRLSVCDAARLSDGEGGGYTYLLCTVENAALPPPVSALYELMWQGDESAHRELASVLRVARSLGLTLLSVRSGAHGKTVMLVCRGAEPLPFLVYAALFYPSSRLVGLYVSPDADQNREPRRESSTRPYL